MRLMLKRGWKRGIAGLLLMTILSSVAAADRACPTQDRSVSHEGGGHQGAAQHHGDDAPAPGSDMECHMMLSCGSAISVQAASLSIVFNATTTQPSLTPPHYTAPLIHQEAPPPKRHA